ncbi:MAG: hypothetical protein ACKESC_00940 [Candidatus Hodgkinia cicadicola]
MCERHGNKGVISRICF